MAILGMLVVIGSVLGGYIGHGGKLPVLIQPTELLIIGGAGLGSVMISAPVPLIKRMIKQLTGALGGHQPDQDEYMELLKLIFELTKMGRQNLMGLEAHVEKPEASDVFKRYPKFLKNHHAVHFLCDTLKVQISSPMSPYDLDDLLTLDMDSAHQEENQAPAAVTKIGDAMPGLGIVAAVLGVVITMGKLTEGKDVIGQSVAAALVGTFLGILLAYGFIQPLAAKMESNIAAEGKYLEVIKAGMIAFSKGLSPKVCLEYARRTVPPELRPDFSEMDAATAGGAKKAA